MARYGAHPLDLAKHLIFEDEGKRDWSVDILLGLATAYLATLKLEERNPTSTLLDNKQLVLKWIERAWRETLYIRASLPSSELNDIERSITISRLGVINEKVDDSRVRWGTDENNSGCAPHEGNPSRKRGAGFRRRRVRRGSGD